MTETLELFDKDLKVSIIKTLSGVIINTHEIMKNIQQRIKKIFPKNGKKKEKTDEIEKENKLKRIQLWTQQQKGRNRGRND